MQNYTFRISTANNLHNCILKCVLFNSSRNNLKYLHLQIFVLEILYSKSFLDNNLYLVLHLYGWRS